MRELLVLNICVWLGYSAVALLVWWVAEDCIETSVAKVLALRMKTSRVGAVLEPTGQLTAVRLATSELALRGLSVPLGP